MKTPFLYIQIITFNTKKSIRIPASRSMNRRISRYKDNFYEALGQSSAGGELKTSCGFPFMESFSWMFSMRYKELDK